MRNQNLLKEAHVMLHRHKRRGNHLIQSCDVFGLDADCKVAQEPLVSSEAIFKRAAELIKSAESEVLISLYKFQNNSDPAQELLKALKILKATGRKVSVKIVINKKCGPATLVSGGGSSSPIDAKLLQSLQSEDFDIQVVEHQHHFTASNHSKAIVVDGKQGIVITGDPSYKNNYGEHAWLELGTEVSGQIAGAMRSHFVEMWNQKNCHMLKGLGKKKPMKKQPFATPKMAYKDGDGIMYLGKAASSDIARDYNSPYKLALLRMLLHAKSRICLMCNNINDPDILVALAKCANRGVEVNIVVGKYHGENAEAIPLAGGTNVESMEKLRGYTERYAQSSLHIRWACDREGYLVQNMGPETIHAKLAVIDDEYILTGSSLPDLQSCHHSRESDVLIKSKAHAQSYLSKGFEPVFNRGRAIESNADKLKTRTEIKTMLRDAQSTDAVATTLEEYILMKEQEEKKHFPRRVLGIFKDMSAYDRACKTSGAIKLKKYMDGRSSCLNLNKNEVIALSDGTLAEIFKAAKEVKNCPITCQV